MEKRKNPFFQTLGPGIIMALAATGTSHLVQSTRAGAGFGFSLLIFIVLANVFKYPFIEYGSRYANLTGKSILEGYLQKGKWILVVYLLVNLATMFTVNGAVTFVTAGLLSHILGINLPINQIAAFVFGLSFLILSIGKYKVLDSLLKLVGAVLAISTIAALLMALSNEAVETSIHFTEPLLTDKAALFFIIALMGWMPTAIELSPWNSLWTLARIKQTGYYPSLKQTLLDFNIGYWSSALLALAFMSLGAIVMYGSGNEFADTSVGFTAQLIGLYTEAMGDWSYWIIAIAAFSTMYSTSITVLDGFSRSTAESIKLLYKETKLSSHQLFVLMMVVVSFGSYLLISTFIGSFSALVDMATTVSFLVAPIMAGINFWVISDPAIPVSGRPKRWMRLLSWSGIVFLTVFSILFLILKLL